MNTTNDDNLDFDRLVDDELTPEERERLLASLDQQPEGWRRCALAFLEQQVWQREMKAFVAEVEQPSPSVLKNTAVASSERSFGGRWLALAAGLLLAFTAGWLVRPEVARQNATQQLATSDNQVEVESKEKPALAVIDDHDVVTLLVRDDQGQARRVRVPLIEMADDDLHSDKLVELVPDDYRQKLHRQGFDLRGRRRYAPLYFEQNEQLVPTMVPVDDAYVVPVSRPVF